MISLNSPRDTCIKLYLDEAGDKDVRLKEFTTLESMTREEEERGSL